MDDAHGYPPELLEAAEALTKLVAADASFDDTLGRMAELSVLAIDGADECCVSLARDSGKFLSTVAATSGVGRKIDELQKETGEGPCMSSMEDHATFHLPNMEKDDTWPIFSKRAAETGINSMLCFVLRLSDTEAGALNMLSRSEDAFSQQDVDTGTLFAAQAAVAMADALGHAQDEKKLVQLEEAMRARQMIGQAVGILRGTRGLDENEAFEVLKRISQTSNIKLREVAQRVVNKAQEV